MCPEFTQAQCQLMELLLKQQKQQLQHPTADAAPSPEADTGQLQETLQKQMLTNKTKS